MADLSGPFSAAPRTQFVPGVARGAGPGSRQSPCQDGVLRKSCLLAWLTNSDCWALHQEHIMEGPRG
eukprot:scaffold250770_cov15-Tisochrysis_lutea.AAC.1